MLVVKVDHRHPTNLHEQGVACQLALVDSDSYSGVMSRFVGVY
jgi:hypothetical protein